MITDGKVILTATFSRLALIPLALGINVMYAEQSWNLWGEVLVFWVFILVLGLTNG